MSAAASAITLRKAKEQELLQSDIEVRSIILDVVDSKMPEIGIGNALISGTILRTIEGASQIALTVHDRWRAILRTGDLRDDKGHLNPVDIEIDELIFRLIKLSKQGDDIVLTFEELAVTYLRGRKGPRKLGTRDSGVTRAEAIYILIRAIKDISIPTRINELHTSQPIAKFTDSERSDRKQRKRDREKAEKDQKRGTGGFDQGDNPAGLNDRQVRRVETALTEADALNVSDRVALCMLAAMAGESDFGENVGGRGTTFQTYEFSESQLKEQAHYFLVGGRSFRAGGAIQAVADHPYWTVGTVASYVEVSDADGAYYDKNFAKCRTILNAWTGGASGGLSSGGRERKRYQFRVKKKETYWDAIQRMAEEVNWRAFVVSGRFYYISEEDLFKTRARYRFGEESDGVSNIDFDWDYRKKVVKATATVRISKWAIPPGCCVTLTGMGPASGKWLVESVSRELFSPEATILLKKPMKERPEPKAELKSSGGNGGGGSTDGKGKYQLKAGLRYPFNIKGKDIGGVAAHGARAFGNWQSDNAVDIAIPMGTNTYCIEGGKIVKLGGSWISIAANPNGYNLTVDCGDGQEWFYTHLHTRSPDLVVGHQIAAGDYIGKSGGANTVEHGHFGCLRGDPEELLGWKNPGGPQLRKMNKPKKKKKEKADENLGADNYPTSKGGGGPY